MLGFVKALHIRMMPYSSSISEGAGERLKKTRDLAGLILKSPLILTFGGMISSACFLPATAVGSILAGTVALMILFPKYIPKALFYEGVIVDNLARKLLTQGGVMNSPYYNKIEEGIYLGAIPLKNFGHDQEITALGVKAVLAVVESYELEQKTFISEAVQRQDWEKNHITFKQISAVDLGSISAVNLHTAADFINQHKTGIYIHCKAGRGRSVMCLIAYLMKHKKMTCTAAIAFTKQKRPAMNLQPHQHQQLIDFEEGLKSNI